MPKADPASLLPPQYATHGGGFPLRVKGVEPLVGVVVVSGLKQEGASSSSSFVCGQRATTWPPPATAACFSSS